MVNASNDNMQNKAQLGFLNLPELYALTEQQRKFVEYYVADPKRNGTEAAVRAKYGKTRRVAASQAYENLNKPEIKAAIKALQDHLSSEADLLPRMIARLRSIAFTSITDVMEWDGQGQLTLKASKELEPDVAAAIASIQDIKEEQQRRLPGMDDDELSLNFKRNVRLHDPLTAIRDLAKILGLGSPDRLELSALDMGALEAARKRVDGR